MLIQPVILSGGAGTRLWPLSRELYPKQLLPLTGERTMLQETVRRLDGLDAGGEPSAQHRDVADPIIVCNTEHRFLVAEQVRALDKNSRAIILEPVGRNTAPALTLAALSVASSGDDPLLLVMPADHVIQDIEGFHSAVNQGAELAEVGYLVTFGIVPTAPETGYGYVKVGDALRENEEGGASHRPFLVDAFVEKPDPATARQYLEAGDYLWNSGMFMMRASVWLGEIQRRRPDILEACSKAWVAGGNDFDFYRVAETAFADCPSDSIDYAVMEKATQADSSTPVAVIPLDAGWSDVGAWSSLWEVSPQDEEGNVIRGDVYTQATCDTLLISEHRFVAGIGLRDLIVVETADAVMVAHKDHAQDVKKIVGRLKAENRVESQVHRRVYRPWGSYEGVDAGDRFQVKRLVVNPGSALSSQMHHHRAEHWIVVKGTARVTRGDDVFLLAENESTYIPIGTKHRLENPGAIPLEMIEVQSGAYLGEDDIVRFDDVYGRAGDKSGR